MKVTLTRADLERLAHIVREETGNQIQEKNLSMIEARICGRMIRLGIRSMEEYWTHFAGNEEAERSIIQSLMTTHYTFFFREYVHFELLEKWLEEESPRLKQRFAATKRPVRVWSAACSRGQEAYSLAMFLHVHLLLKHGVEYQIVGTDIDSESVAYASNAVYPLKEVNTIPQRYLNGHWKMGAGAVQHFAAVHPHTKARVRFETVNLLELPKWKEAQTFDVIFCRNVFIYFSEENVKAIATGASARLEPGGLFVSGVSEPIRFNGWNMKMDGPSCYRKQLPSNAEKADAPARPTVQAPAPQTAPATARYRVLCVDDSPTVQLILKKIFTGDPNCAGVETALNGREAREKLNKTKFDLITLDIHMPEVNGIEFLERHYDRRKDPPVLMVSSVNRTDADLATKAISLGAFDYVEKPAMNTLGKSRDEILIKTKMALRAGPVTEAAAPGGFDSAIGRQIVVPDASRCLRIVFASSKSVRQLEQVVRGQRGEYRSPGLLVIWDGKEDGFNLEGEMLNWTDRQVTSLRNGAASLFKPNHVYIAKIGDAKPLINSITARSASVQLLDSAEMELSEFAKANPAYQVLIDESLGAQQASIERRLGIKVSDMTPATSFPSLSVEFFAGLRGKVA